ncbi:MAG: metallophosphoesterase [Pseudomonadota bacterium]
MKTRTLVHISDLHLGKNLETERQAIAIRDSLMAADADHVVVTGDLTHRGRVAELALFWRIFAPLVMRDRITVVPGNHDRLGDDLAEAIQAGPRVAVTDLPGLRLVRFDSTGPHNRTWLAGHGQMTPDDVAAIGDAVGASPSGAVVAVLLHHHVLPLPADHTAERIVSWLGWPYADELEQGRTLLSALRGRCDLVLHGHRHTPQGSRLFAEDQRPLSVFNAGSSTELGRVRVFGHESGQLQESPAWLTTWTVPDEVSAFRRRRRPEQHAPSNP